MEAFFEKVAAINGSVNGVVWGIFGLVLIVFLFCIIFSTSTTPSILNEFFQLPVRSRERGL